MLPHFGGIVINSKTVIGNNCNILQGVTLGNTKRGKKMGAPTIGNKVYLGPNAVVVGGVFIGDNVLIAPNSFVNIDIPSNSIFVSGKIINKDNATEGYLLNILSSN
jgi:serine O-acetyltransferase